MRDFIGNAQVQAFLAKLVDGQKRGIQFPNLLMISAPGMGKSTLIKSVASDLGKKSFDFSASTLKDSRDFLPALAKVEAGDVFFIDEIHQANRNSSEALMTMIQEDRIFYRTTAGIQDKLIAKIIYLAATTDPHLILEPLRKRFVPVMLNPYTTAELEEITKLHMEKQSLAYDEDKVIRLLVANSRYIPRAICQYICAAKSYAEKGVLKIGALQEMFRAIGVSLFGLFKFEKDILVTLATGTVMGIDLIAQTLGISSKDVETVYEPYLTQLGFVERTPRGRKITEKGKKYLIMSVDNG